MKQFRISPITILAIAYISFCGFAEVPQKKVNVFKGICNDKVELVQRYQNTARLIRELFASDPHKPGYHFLPPMNWMNDINGPIYYKGQYHIFFQYNPFSAVQKSHKIYWGHAVSDDMVHWKDLPVAISPEPLGYDMGGCWSGNIVVYNDIGYLFYLSIPPIAPPPAGQSLAVSYDGLLTWEKYPCNPVIPSGGGDPFVWRHEDEWLMLVSGNAEGRGIATLYKSNNLFNWDLVKVLVKGDPKETGEHWEIPNLFRLGGKDVFIVGCQPGPLTKGFVGKFENYTFTEETGPFDIDNGYYYAATLFEDAMKRRIMLAWAMEGRSVEAQKKAEWAGVMPIPRVVELAHDNTLRYKPIEEIKSLRGKYWNYENIDIQPEGFTNLNQVKGDMLEIIGKVDVSECSELNLDILLSEDRKEKTAIVYDRLNSELICDRSQSSLSSDTEKDPRGGKLILKEGELLELHIFIDRSIIEIIANERCCITQRVYPTKPDSKGVGFSINSGKATVKSIQIWEMSPIWPIK